MAKYLKGLEDQIKKDAARKKQKMATKAKKQKIEELSYEIQEPTSLKILGEIKGYEASFINLNQATLFEYLLVTGNANGIPFSARKTYSPNPTDTEELLDLGKYHKHCAILTRGKTQWKDYTYEPIDEWRWSTLGAYLLPYGVRLVRVQEEVPAFVLDGLACNAKVIKTTLRWEKI